MSVDATGRTHKPAGSPASSGGQFAPAQSPRPATQLPAPAPLDATALVLLIEDALSGDFHNRMDELYSDDDEVLWGALGADDREQLKDIVHANGHGDTGYAASVSAVDAWLAERFPDAE